MNEILFRKKVKEIEKYGIQKQIAKEIVEVAMETCNGRAVDTYIEYAISLKYGLGREIVSLSR